jgi:CBS domain-containing protein
MHSSVRQVLNKKGSAIFSITPTETVFEAVKRMAEHGCGALIVMRGDELVGILSERDYARKVVLQGRSSKETTVGDIMSSPVVTAVPQQKVGECMALMTTKRIRHLPVIEDGKVIGVLSIGDLVKFIIADQQFQIEQMSQYIAGS